jgi:hypothetical protein
MVAISIERGRVELPEHLTQPPPTLEDLKALYVRDSADPLIFPLPGKYCFGVPIVPREHRHEFIRTWARSVLSRPATYLRHRAGLFAASLGIGRPTVLSPYTYGVAINGFGWKFEMRPLTRWVLSKLDPISSSLFFRGWVYAVILVVAALLLPFAREAQGFDILTVSGLATLVTNFFILPQCDFRYILWPVVTAVLVVGACALRFVRRGPNARALLATPRPERDRPAVAR